MPYCQSVVKPCDFSVDRLLDNTVDIYQLETALLAEGCNCDSFAIGNKGSASDAFCIVHQNGQWNVFYTERGCDSPPVFTSHSEAEACDFFFKLVSTIEHWHLVGFFKNEDEADQLFKRIQELGLKPLRNDIPNFNFRGDARYRVYVIGKDIFQVKESIPEAPINTA